MYIGNDLQIAHPSYKIIDDISSGFNGSTTSFALQVSGATPVPFPISTQQVMISVNGVVQEPDPSGSAGFKLLGSNIVFSSAPANGHAFFGVINAGADYVTAGSEFPDGSATAPSFTFQDDQDTGWFRSGSGAVGYSANGVQKVLFDGNGLTVSGDVSIADKIVHTGDTNTALRFPAADTFAIETAGSERARVDSIGRVLVGHTANLSEGCLLQVARANDNTVELFGYSANANGTRINFTKSRGGAIGDNVIVQDGDSLGQLHFRSADGSGYFRSAAIEAYVDGTPGANDVPGRLVFSTTADGANTQTERMRIDSAGRVGINIGAPEELLHIRDSSAPAIQLEAWAGGPFKSLIKMGGNDMEIRGSSGSMEFYTGNADGDSSTLALTINSSQNATFAGTITSAGGISLTATTQNTHLGLLASSTAINFSLGSTSGSSPRMYFYGTGNGQSSAGDVFVGTGSGGILHFRSAESIKFEVDSDNSTAEALSIAANKNATFAGTVSDSKGELRKIPLQDESSGAYTLVASDAGKAVHCHSSTTAVTVNPSVFAASDAVTIVNGGTSDLTITQGSSFTLRNSADASTGNRTLAQFGMATIWFSGHNVGFISGAGLS